MYSQLSNRVCRRKLRNDFRDFAEKVTEDGSNALIKALEEVMRDFNAKINEQFGENFKQLNEAVTALLEWQKEHKKQVEELTEIFRIRNLNVYFQRILGSPSNKIENISKLNISDVKETIFFGDSLSDYNAAMHFNFDFVYVKNYSLWKVPENIKKSSGYREINNFSFLKISN